MMNQPNQTTIGILGTLVFLLVRLVAVPHFDSPFDETDHVFILNRGRKTLQANMKAGRLE